MNPPEVNPITGAAEDQEAALRNAVADHHDVISAAQTSIAPIMKSLRLPRVAAGKQAKITIANILQACLKVISDPRMKAVLERVNENYPRIEAAFFSAPQHEQDRIIGLMKGYHSAKDLNDLDAQLQTTANEHPDTVVGVEMARRLLAQGRSTIYNPDNAFFTFTSGGVKAIARDQDLATATADVGGAVGGALVGGPLGTAIAIADLGLGASLGYMATAMADAIVGTDDVPLFDDIIDKFPVPQ